MIQRSSVLVYGTQANMLTGKKLRKSVLKRLRAVTDFETNFEQFSKYNLQRKK